MRCGLCGSRQVSLVTKNSYSMKKGIVGAAVLGPVGAVAGINGNQSQVYHCMACGQDTLSVLDGTIEREIDEILASGDLQALEKYKRRWKNIEMPIHSAITRHYDETHEIEGAVINNKMTTTATGQAEEVSSLALLSEEELKNSIKDDLSSRELPYTEQELASKYQANKKFNDVYTSILKEGSAHTFWINGTKYIKVAKNLEDISQYVQMTNAEIQNRSDIAENVVLVDIKQIISEKKSTSIDDLTSEFKARHPEYDISGNQYAFSSLVESALDKMLKNNTVKYEGNLIRLSSDSEHVEYLYKKAYEYAKEKNKKALEEAKKYHWDYYNKLARKLNSTDSEIEVNDVISSTDQLGVSKVYHFLESMSGKEVQKISISQYKAKYRRIVDEIQEKPVPEDLHDVTLLHNRNMGEKLLNAMRGKDGVEYPYSEILTIVNEKYKNNKIKENSDAEIRLFIELLYYQKNKHFKYKKDNGEHYWRFIDREKEQYNRLLKEKQRNEETVETLKLQLETAKEEHEQNLVHAESLRFIDDPVLEKEIADNENKIRELEEALPSLQGLFKKKKREEVENNISLLTSDNEKKKAEIEEKRKAADIKVQNEIRRTKEPIDSLEKEIKQCEERLAKLNADIQKMNINNQEENLPEQGEDSN